MKEIGGELLRVLVDAAPDAIMLVGTDGRIVAINATTEALFGYSRDELLGQPVEMLVPSRFRGEHVARRAAFFSAPRPRAMAVGQSLAALRKDQTEFPAEIALNPFKGSEGELLVVAAVRDVTERKKIENALRASEAVVRRTGEQLQQSQKMEAVGRLAGGVAHDFNNLLTAVTGYSELALGLLGADDPVRQHVEEIKKAGQRAALLTHQLLAFSRKQVLQPKVLDLNAVVSDMDKMLRRIIGEDIDLVTVHGRRLGRVKADPSQLDQVIVNLAVNARDAMPNGGKLTIETKNVEFYEAYCREHEGVAPGPHVMLAVTDTGEGMSKETLAHVFEPFFTTKGPGKGTGLGLSVIHGIVKQSGGHIWVYSEIGHGTTFKIYLPRVEDLATPVSGTAILRPSPRGSETVLLVEDEATVRQLARTILDMHGYKVLEATDPADAVLIGQKHADPIHLLVTDVVMPTMNGRQLYERLAPLRPDMRVLYMSGYTENAIVHHGVLDPSTAFIQKPYTVDALARAVREALDAPRME